MTGLVLVHTFCRWPVEHSVEGSARAVQYISSEWLKLIIANAEQFCILAVSKISPDMLCYRYVTVPRYRS